MSEYLSWVKRVSHVNKKSSKITTDWNLIFFGFLLLFVLVFSSKDISAFASDISTQKIIELANADRKEKGLSDFIENEKLSRAAEKKAEDMISQNYFSHTSPGGVTPWHWIEEENYEYSFAGENLAMDFSSSEKMNEAWMASPSHRANILNPRFKNIGVAAMIGKLNGRETTVVVQMFGSGDKNSSPKKSDEAEKKKNAKNEISEVVPNLPVRTEGGEKNKLIIPEPYVTSPQKNEMLSERSTEVFGRATPGAKLYIFDRENLVADSVSDENGWFKTRVSNLEEGSHILKLESEISAGRKKEMRVSSATTNFSVDVRKPKIKYRIFENESNGGVFASVSCDKPDAVLEVGEKKMSLSSDAPVHIPLSKEILSVSLLVRDSAGNKAYGAVNLAGFYFPGRNANATSVISSMIAKRTFAAESGREAMKKKIGIISHQFQISEVYGQEGPDIGNR